MEGGGFAKPLAATELFPGAAKQMFKVGEETGTLDQQLEVASSYFDRELSGRIQRFTAMCGTTLPAKLITRLEVAAENTDVVETIGIDWALAQIRDLLAHGAPGYHLYILNRAKGALALTAGLAA